MRAMFYSTSFALASPNRINIREQNSQAKFPQADAGDWVWIVSTSDSRRRKSRERFCVSLETWSGCLSLLSAILFSCRGVSRRHKFISVNFYQCARGCGGKAESRIPRNRITGKRRTSPAGIRRVIGGNTLCGDPYLSVFCFSPSSSRYVCCSLSVSSSKFRVSL